MMGITLHFGEQEHVIDGTVLEIRENTGHYTNLYRNSEGEIFVYDIRNPCDLWAISAKQREIHWQNRKHSILFQKSDYFSEMRVGMRTNGILFQRRNR